MNITKGDQLLDELAHLALRINKETNYCAFVRFAGHVNEIEIEITKSKTKYLENIIKIQFYLDGRCIAKLRGAKKKLIELLEKEGKDEHLSKAN